MILLVELPACVSFHSGRVSFALHCHMAVLSFISGTASTLLSWEERAEASLQSDILCSQQVPRKDRDFDCFQILAVFDLHCPSCGKLCDQFFSRVNAYSGKIHFLLSSPSAVQKDSTPSATMSSLGLGQERV